MGCKDMLYINGRKMRAMDRINAQLIALHESDANVRKVDVEEGKMI